MNVYTQIGLIWIAAIILVVAIIALLSYLEDRWENQQDD